jgi:DNA gyrase subunit B
MSLSETFTDCHEGADAPELFIVEGTSAANAVEIARDPTRQAVLAVRGKPINVEAARKSEIDRNERVRDVVSAVHLGAESETELRWSGVHLLTDADVDGVHTRALLLLLFDLLLPEVIASRRLFMVRAPMYSVTSTEHPQPVFAGSAEQRDSVELQMRDRKMTGISSSYFKGVASMNADDLWTACLNPQTRVGHELTSEHAAAARRAFSSMRSR